MNTPLRHVVFVLLGCFVILFAQTNRVQIFDAESLRDNPANTRTILQEFDRPRSNIITSDQVLVAFSDRAESGTFGLQRRYPEGELYAHTVGYVSFTIGAEGVERSYNDEIIGRTLSQQLSDLTDLLDPNPELGSVVLTLDHGVQSVAQAALGEREGSVVALDPRTGAVRAMWSYPSFDPNGLADIDSNVANSAFQELKEADGNPLRARAFRDIAFPGSTFKVVTAAAALESGEATLTAPEFPANDSYTAPLTERPITNFGGRTCGGNLIDLLVVSCNTPFAFLAAEVLGPEFMVNQAEAAGFNNEIPFDIPGGVASVVPTDYGDQIKAPSEELRAGLYQETPILAQVAIGQNDVSATPLQMALMIAGVANGGTIPTPHVVDQITGPNGQTVQDINPGPWRQSMQEQTATDLRQALVEAAVNGSGNTAIVPGLEVGAKTGTAQLGTDPPRSHAWIVAFAGRPGEEPELAVAVLVEGNEGNSEQTGGRVAGPIAKAVIEKYFSTS